MQKSVKYAGGIEMLIFLGVDFSWVGIVFAFSGAIISLLGVYANNIMLAHDTAIRIWAISNPLILAWAIGFTCGWWVDGITGLAMVAIYLVFTVTGIHALLKTGTTTPDPLA